jgi:23S rRNA-/tRNA-specific pseudouridylate synthase
MVIRLAASESGERWVIPVLWEDQYLLALDKPAGLALRPFPGEEETPDLLGLLHRGIAQQAGWAKDLQLGYLDTPQQLEPEFSGVALFVRDQSCWPQVSDQFATHRPCESILALVEGQPDEAFTVEAALAKKPTPTGFYRMDQRRGKKARSDFNVEERFRGHALLRCVAAGRRIHQIRAHLRQARLRLAGDTLYGGRPLLLSRLKAGYRFKRDREERPLIGRPALHVQSLQLTHPKTGAPFQVEAPCPKDFEVSLKYLRKFNPVVDSSLPGAVTGRTDQEGSPADA